MMVVEAQDMIQLSEREFASLFEKYEEVRKGEAGEPVCPHCSNALSPENMRYYESNTEAGTGFTQIEIECDVCRRDIWVGTSWSTWIRERKDLYEAADEALENLFW